MRELRCFGEEEVNNHLPDSSTDRPDILIGTNLGVVHDGIGIYKQKVFSGEIFFTVA